MIAPAAGLTAGVVAPPPAPNPAPPAGGRIMSNVDGGGVTPAGEALSPTGSPRMSRMGIGRAAPTNPGFADLTADLAQADIDRMVSQIRDRDVGLLDQARQIPLIGLDAAIDNLPNADQLSNDDRQALRDAIANGDPNAVRDLLGDAANSPAGADLIDRAAAIQTIDGIRNQLINDIFAAADLANLMNAAQELDLPIADELGLLDLVGQLAVDQQLTDWLQDTDPGVGDVPFDADVPLVLVPGLPDGLMMPLDSGAVMIGTGEPGDAILLGTGNPFEVAGLPVALPGAEPADPATGPIASGQIMLANPTAETVNYNLNQEPQQMSTDFEQTLDAGTSWLIEFDRGGDFGMARYTLIEGYYYFKITEQGWDLVRKTFKAKLDNSGNKFAFNYLIGDEQQTLNPGETHDLTGSLPPVLRFDNGNGQEMQRRLDSGTYRVAISEDAQLDVYAAESVSAPQPSAVAATNTGAKAPSASLRAVAKAVVSAAPAPAAEPTAGPAAMAKKKGQKLPNGFTLFDPVKALTSPGSARRLPASFTLFRAAADKLQVSAKR